MDVIVANSTNNTVSVLRSTGSSGGITSNSLAAKVDFSTGSSPYKVALGDLDGDGKVDLAVANSLSNTVSVLRNTITGGSITSGSFAPKVDFATAGGPRAVAVGDVDGDGRVDMAVADWSGNLVSVLRNNLGAPPAPQLYVASAGNGQVTLAWSKNAEPDFLRYRIYGGTSSAPITKLDSTLAANPGDTTRVIKGLTNNTTYYFRVTAIDSAGNESDYSNEMSATPIPPTAPVPTISSFSPISAPTGTTVSISGTNFSTVASNNVVFFGAVRANVISASSTFLLVTAPAGASYSPITITTGGLTAVSRLRFALTFASSQTIDAQSYAAPVNFSTASGPWATAAGDLDGDGKPDLIIANNNGSAGSTISVFLNTSSTGSVSFGTRKDLTVGVGPNRIAVADVDGDGKLDLVVSNGVSNTVSILRNTGSVGSISFASKADFSVGTNPGGLAIADFDGDGLLDIATANLQGNSVSVLRNQSTIASIVFASKVDFATSTGPLGIAVGDLDGDGLPDIVASISNNGSGTTVSVLRNQSTVGSLQFVTKQDFATGQDPRRVELVDLDGDGKLDILAMNSTAGTISVLRNQSSTGSVAFSARSAYATASAPQDLAVADLDADGRPDVVTSYLSGGISLQKNASSLGTISIATKIDFTTGSSGCGVTVADFDLDGKPDIAAPNGSVVSVLRNTMVGLSTPTLSY